MTIILAEPEVVPNIEWFIENEITLYIDPEEPEVRPELRTIELTGANTIAWFEILLNRAMATWDDAPHELKTFADMFIHGKELQNYIVTDARNTIINPPPTRT